MRDTSLPKTASAEPGDALRILRFEDRILALGLAVNYLMSKPAFARLPFGHWSRVLAGQINRGHYFFVFEGKKVVGFAGWALASEAEAEAWHSGRSNPAAEKGSTGACIILNAWDASTPQANKALLQQMRREGKDKLAIYAKREYPDGRSRRLKLSVNDFVGAHLDGTKRAAPEAAG
jgi:hemolysin-activating ACP:hemolysin acyltransferase